MSEKIEEVCGEAEKLVEDLEATRSLLSDLKEDYGFEIEAVSPLGKEKIYITSHFGDTKGRTKPHVGTDFVAIEGDPNSPTYALAGGKVALKGTQMKGDEMAKKGYGHYIIVMVGKGKHGWGYMYAHLKEKVKFEKEETIKVGDSIGHIGKSGTEKEHVHFEVLKDASKYPPSQHPSNNIDPERFFGKGLERLPTVKKKVKLYGPLNDEDRKKLKEKLYTLEAAYRNSAKCSRLLEDMCRKAPPQARLGQTAERHKKMAQQLDKTAEQWKDWADNLKDRDIELFHWLDENPGILDKKLPEVRIPPDPLIPLPLTPIVLTPPPLIPEKPKPKESFWASAKKRVSNFSHSIRKKLADTGRRIRGWFSNIYAKK